jgi:hypothetical protein
MRFSSRVAGSLGAWKSELRDMFNEMKTYSARDIFKTLSSPREFLQMRRMSKPRCRVALHCRGVHLDFQAK